MNTTPPRVSLVGAGPGDPELLTVKAVHALRRATLVLVDDLVADGVLRYVRRSARIVHVGKRGGGLCVPGPSPATVSPRGAPRTLGRPGGSPSTPQSFIEKLMIAEARRGERVVRLKGGDPFVFGRGGEECDALRAAGIEVEVIPGITAGIAAPAAIGIPVTDRRYTQGVARVQRLVDALRQGGLADATPAAVISAAHTPRQRHALCSLATLASTLAREALPSPAILVIGDVVRAAPMFAGLALPAAQRAR